jgi:hypothetical protein
MIEPITQSRWQEAQAAELTATSYERENSRRAYAHIFDYLGMPEDCGGKTIIEVGCGPFPATTFVVNLEPVLVEPLWFRELARLVGAVWLMEPFEDAEVVRSDEIWLFNCLQHVRDPELVITKAKEIAPVVRFFEPVDYPTCVYHPHTFTEDDFRRWFGDSVKRYTDRLSGFFDADCCYGTWRAE